MTNLIPNFWNQSSRSASPFSRNFLRDLMSLEATGLRSPEFTPSCDIEETDTHYVMSFDLPGVKKENIKIELQDSQLRVSGERKEEREEKKRSRYQSERFYGSFERIFSLPASIKAEQIEANYAEGVLTITVPKTMTAKVHTVKIGESKPSEKKTGVKIA